MIVATSKIRIFWLALSLGVFTIPNFAGAARQGSAVPPIDFNAIIGSLDKDQCSLVLRDFFGRIEDTEILQDQAVETFFLELLKASERGSIQPRMVIKLVTSRLEKQEPSTKALSIIFRMLSLFSKQRLLSDLELLVFFDRFAHHEVPRVAAAGRGLNLALTFLDELLEKSESPHMIEVVFERYHAIAALREARFWDRVRAFETLAGFTVPGRKSNELPKETVLEDLNERALDITFDDDDWLRMQRINQLYRQSK